MRIKYEISTKRNRAPGARTNHAGRRGNLEKRGLEIGD
jgi:hypothetical protein